MRPEQPASASLIDRVMNEMEGQQFNDAAADFILRAAVKKLRSVRPTLAESGAQLVNDEQLRLIEDASRLLNDATKCAGLSQEQIVRLATWSTSLLHAS